MKVFYDIEGHMTRVWFTDALNVGVEDPKKPTTPQVYVAIAIYKTRCNILHICDVRFSE